MHKEQIMAALEATKLENAETFIALVVHRVNGEHQPTLFVFNENEQLDNGNAIVRALLTTTRELLKLPPE